MGKGEPEVIVLGEEVQYEFTTEQDVHEKPVELELTAWDRWGIDNRWRETRTARRVEGNKYRASWVVRLHETDEDAELEPPVEIQCTAVGLGNKTERLRLDMRQVTLTEDPRLTRIMLHEFSKDEGYDEWVFDPTEPQAYIDDLTPQQRKLLCTHPVPEGQKARLVAFVRMLPKDQRDWMLGNYGYIKTGEAKANASFAVFRVPREGNVELLCYTKYLLVNAVNDSTRKQWASLHSAKELHPTNPEPPKYCLVTGKPDDRNYGVPYIRIYSPEGHNFMPGNSIHGLVNTKGCWMLFRNYNWPAKGSMPDEPARDPRREMMRIYMTKRGDDIKTALAEIGGYTREKYLFDRNYAYFFFLHEVLGLRYWGRDGWTGFGGINDYESHGKLFQPEKPSEGEYEYKALKYPDEAKQVQVTNDEGRVFHFPMVGYPTFDRDDYPDTLWGENILGDVTGSWAGKEVYVRGKGRVLENPECAWADLFLYKGDDAELPTPTPGE